MCSELPCQPWLHPNHDAGRHRERLINLPPQVKAVRVVVDVLASWRVELHNTIAFIPKHAFDLAHFIPRWAAVAAADADVFPSHCIAGEDKNLLAMLQLDFKGARIADAVFAAKSSCANAAFVWNMECHDYRPVLPNPPSPRSVLASSLTCTSSTRMTGAMTS